MGFEHPGISDIHLAVIVGLWLAGVGVIALAAVAPVVAAEIRRVAAEVGVTPQ